MSGKSWDLTFRVDVSGGVFSTKTGFENWRAPQVTLRILAFRGQVSADGDTLLSFGSLVFLGAGLDDMPAQSGYSPRVRWCQHHVQAVTPAASDVHWLWPIVPDHGDIRGE